MSPGRQLGLLWGGVAAGLVALSPLASRWVPVLPACPVKSFTGLPCVTCGTTRAALSLAELDFPAAFAVNPLAALAWLALVGGGLAAGVYALFGGEIREPRWTFGAPARIAVVVALLLDWAYVVRFVG